MGIVLFPLFPIFKSLSIFAAFSVLGLFVVIFLAPETKNKSLEQNVEAYTASK